MLWQRFDKRVRKLIRGINFLDHDAAILNCVPKVISFYSDVFGLRLELVRFIDKL